MSYRGYFYILVAATIWGSMAVASKLAFFYNMSYLSLSFYRSLFYFMFATIFFSFKKTRFDRFLIFVGAIYTASMIISYMASVYLVGAAFAAFMINTAPIYVLIVSILLLREEITKIKILSLLLSITGVYFLTQPEITSNFLGVLAGVLSGVSYAALSLTTKFYIANRDYESGVIIIYQLMWLSFIPIGLIAIMLGDPLYINLESGILALYIGLFPTGVAYYFYGKGLEDIEVSRVSIVATFETVAASILAFVILGELMHVISYIGGFLIILGISILSTEK